MQHVIQTTRAPCDTASQGDLAGRLRHSSDIPKFFPGRAELPAAPVTQLAMETNHRLAKGFGVSIKRIEQARAELKIPEPKIIRERFKPLEDI